MNNTSSVMNNARSVMKTERKDFVPLWPKIGLGKKIINPLREKAHKVNTVSQSTCCIGWMGVKAAYKASDGAV
jgi:hypothetical protein